MAKTDEVEVTESRMHRYRVGDVVSWNDTSQHPAVQYEGEIKAFANKEGTYLLVELHRVDDEDGKTFEKELTEDEVTRVG